MYNQPSIPPAEEIRLIQRSFDKFFDLDIEADFGKTSNGALSVRQRPLVLVPVQHVVFAYLCVSLTMSPVNADCSHF